MAIATGLLSPAVVAGMTGGGGIKDGLLAPKRPLYARLYDRIVPGSGEDDSDADKVAAFRQGLLGLAAGMAQTGGQGFMGALGTGLATGLEQLNAGRDSMANARYKQMLMASQGGDPAGLREFNELTRIASDPNETPERRQAASVRLGMTGRASSAGYSLVKFTGADGRPRVGTLNGQTGRIDTPDGLSFSPSAVQITGIGAQGYAPDAPTQRAANGEPVRIDPSVPAWLRDQILANPDGGEYHQPDAGTFTPAPAIPRTTNPSAWAGPTAAEEAAAVTAATERTKLSLMPTELDIRTRAAVDQAGQVAAATAQAERDAEAPKRIARYQQAISSAGNVIDSISNATKLVGKSSTGFIGARSRGFEGSPAYNLAAEIETIKANLGFDRLQQMRDNSPTGGALGSVAVQELTALQSTISNLDPNQSEDQLRENLDRVKTHYENWMNAVKSAIHDERMGAARSEPAAPPANGGWGIQRVK